MTNNVSQEYTYNREKDTWTERENTQILTHFEATNISSTTGYVLIDKSDTTNYPHTHTGCLGLLHYHVVLNPGGNYVGNVQIGFLEDVDTNNGDFYPITTYTMQKQPATEVENVVYDYPVLLNSDDVITVQSSDDSTWQTDSALSSPNGTSNPGDGDFVMKVTVSSDDIAVSISSKYISCNGNEIS